MMPRTGCLLKSGWKTIMHSHSTVDEDKPTRSLMATRLLDAASAQHDLEKHNGNGNRLGGPLTSLLTPSSSQEFKSRKGRVQAKSQCSKTRVIGHRGLALENSRHRKMLLNAKAFPVKFHLSSGKMEGCGPTGSE